MRAVGIKCVLHPSSQLGKMLSQGLLRMGWLRNFRFVGSEVQQEQMPRRLLMITQVHHFVVAVSVLDAQVDLTSRYCKGK